MQPNPVLGACPNKSRTREADAGEKEEADSSSGPWEDGVSRPKPHPISAGHTSKLYEAETRGAKAAGVQGVRVGRAGRLCGACRVSVWGVQDVCVGRAGCLYGACRASVWGVQGVCVGRAGCLCGACRVSVWGLQGVCVGRAGCLCGACRVCRLHRPSSCGR